MGLGWHLTANEPEEDREEARTDREESKETKDQHEVCRQINEPVAVTQ